MHVHQAIESCSEEVIGPLSEVLSALAAGAVHPPATSSADSPPESSLFGGPALDMDAIMDAVGEDFRSSRPKDVLRQMSGTLLDYINGEPVYDEDSDPEEQPTVPGFDDFSTRKSFI